MLTSDDIRRSYVDFFTSRGHTEIPGSSLIGDSTVLFTSAGMQPLIPYFSGAPHPSGRRLVNVQRCLRTVDIDEVGDDSHLTCFEMLGNWSLGDYYKHESLGWTLEWLLSIGLPFERLGVTVFAEDDVRARLSGAKLGVPDERVRVLRARGQLVGPARSARPVRAGLRDLLHPRRRRAGWSSATTSSSSTSSCRDGSLRALPQHNVDVGLGLERIACLLQGVDSVYDTDLFTGRCARSCASSARRADERAERIVCDHVRSVGAARARRRPAVQHRARLRPAPAAAARDPPGPHARHRRPVPARRWGGPCSTSPWSSTCSSRRSAGSRGTLRRGLRRSRGSASVDGRELFRLFETYGLPPELTLEELGVPPGWGEDFEPRGVQSTASALSEGRSA